MVAGHSCNRSVTGCQGTILILFEVAGAMLTGTQHDLHPPVYHASALHLQLSRLILLRIVCSKSDATSANSQQLKPNRIAVTAWHRNHNTCLALQSSICLIK